LKNDEANGPVDFIVHEHYFGRCLNAGIFYSRAGKFSALWFLRYLSWAHRYAYGAEQNLFDAAFGHSAWGEPHDPFELLAKMYPDDQDPDTKMMVLPRYRLLDEANEFLLADGVKPGAPWWSGSNVDSVIGIHFITASQKAKAWSLFSSREAELRCPRKTRLRALLRSSSHLGRGPRKPKVHCYSGMPYSSKHIPSIEKQSL